MTLSSPIICPLCGLATWEIVERNVAKGCIIERDICCNRCDKKLEEIEK